MGEMRVCISTRAKAGRKEQEMEAEKIYYREKRILSQSKPLLIAKELNLVTIKCFLFPQETKQEERGEEERMRIEGEGGSCPTLPSHSWLSSDRACLFHTQCEEEGVRPKSPWEKAIGRRRASCLVSHQLAPKTELASANRRRHESATPSLEAFWLTDGLFYVKVELLYHDREKINSFH